MVSFPRLRPGGRLELARVVPSGRSVALGLSLLALGALVWAGARLTSVFAVERVAVSGAPRDVAADVRGTLASVEGQSLLALDVDALRARVESLPTVAAASFDRAFPDTLAVVVVPERPAAVLRQGAHSWLASSRARVVAPLARGARPALPRVWLGRGVRVRVGDVLRGDAAAAVSAVAPLAGSSLRLRVASASASSGNIVLKLRGGLAVRLGDGADLALKLAVAASVVPELDEDAIYLDVGIPRWPVAGNTLDSQVQTEG